MTDSQCYTTACESFGEEEDKATIMRVMKKLRTNADSNPLEFAVGYAIKRCDPMESLIKPDWLHCPTSEKFREKYLNKAATIQSQIVKFNQQRPPEFDNCKQVWVLEKKQFNHPVLKGVDRKTAKADVWLEMNDDSIMGLSVKDSANATKTNFSVENLMNPDDRKRVKDTRKSFLSASGFPKHVKEERDRVNALFYDRNNPYFAAIRETIATDSNIAAKLMNHLYSLDSPVKMWEFDGTTLKQLGPGSAEFVSFEEDETLYTGKCAKMFYRLTVKEGEVHKNYRVEIRGKGDVHNASMQFQVHEALA
jgi:hypothetical protein